MVVRDDGIISCDSTFLKSMGTKRRRLQKKRAKLVINQLMAIVAVYLEVLRGEETEVETEAE